MLKRVFMAALIACSFFAVSTPALSEELKMSAPPPSGVDSLVEVLQKKGVLSGEEAAAFREKAAKQAAPGAETDALVELLKEKNILSADEAAAIKGRMPGKPVIVISPEKEREIIDKAKEEVTLEMDERQRQMRATVQQDIYEGVSREIPSWVERIRFGGDVRVRYQGDFFDENNADFLNPANPTELLNSKTDRSRFLLRARLNAIARVADEVEAGIGIATGTTSNPVSTNAALGDYENKDGIVLDLGYIKLSPVSSLSVWAGRFPNPFFYTDLVWDHDLRFDGAGLNYFRDLSSRYAVFLNGVISPLQEVSTSSHDKWLYGIQGGLQYKPRADVTGKLGVAYYYYQNVTGEVNDPLRPGEKDYTAPQFQQKGNTLFDIDPSSALKLALAPEYHLLNLTGQLELAFWQPVFVTFWGDYVTNLGFDQDEVAQRTGNPNVDEQTLGYQFGLSVGHKDFSRFGDWKVFMYYNYLEADAVLDAFTDSDFHGGGTNARGWVIGGELGVYRNTWFRVKWFSTNEIEGPPFAQDTLQVDLNAKF